MELPDGVSLEKLLRLYEQDQARVKKRNEFLKTDEGKEYARQKAKLHYQRHKAEVLAKRAERYKVDSELLNQRAKEYYAANKETILAKERAARVKVEPPAV